MPSGLFKRENNHWVFSGPTPPSFQGYDQDHSKLLVDYIFQLTPEEQRRVAASMGTQARAAASKQKQAAALGSSKQRRFAVECCCRRWLACGSAWLQPAVDVRANDQGLSAMTILKLHRKGDIMNQKLWSAMFVLLACWSVAAAGCSKKENTNEEQTTSPSSKPSRRQPATPIDPAPRPASAAP